LRTTGPLAHASVALCLLAACANDGRTPLPGTTPTPGASASGEPPLPSPLPAVAAKVNEQTILTRNVRISAERMLGRGEIPGNEVPIAYRRATENLIDRELLFQEADRRHLAVDPKQLAEAENQIRVGYKDAAEWRAFLAQQGMDEPAFRAELRVQHTVQALMKAVAQTVPGPIPDAEVRAYYDANPQAFETGPRFHASHILIRVPKDSTQAKKAELRQAAEGLLARIRKGEDFATLAGTHSQDSESAKQGGRLPIFAKGQMVPAFAAAVDALKPKQVSDVVETPFGFHVLQLHERLPSQKATFELVRERLGQHLLEQKRQQALQALVRTLRSQAKIETFL
jgi:parvulin-like peptidyl-prolyl isomerase